MAKQNDIPVKVAGKLYRFISNGEQAGLFSKSGLEQELKVVEVPKGRGMPKVQDAEGNAVHLSRAARPCSCKGAPWNTRYTTLKDGLNVTA